MSSTDKNKIEEVNFSLPFLRTKIIYNVEHLSLFDSLLQHQKRKKCLLGDDQRKIITTMLLVINLGPAEAIFSSHRDLVLKKHESTILCCSHDNMDGIRSSSDSHATPTSCSGSTSAVIKVLSADALVCIYQDDTDDKPSSFSRPSSWSSLFGFGGCPLKTELMSKWKPAEFFYGKAFECVPLFKSESWKVNRPDGDQMKRGEEVSGGNEEEGKELLNLWFAPASTNCAIHQHEAFFREVHTQVFGIGHMQKFTEKKFETTAKNLLLNPEYNVTGLYEDVILAPGMTHKYFFYPTTRKEQEMVEQNKREESKLTTAEKNDNITKIDNKTSSSGKGEIVVVEYPWHQYYAETDCIWLAIEEYYRH